MCRVTGKRGFRRDRRFRNRSIQDRCGVERSVSIGAAFTLVELLVVLAIVGVLLSLLLPAAQTAREAARRLECAHHLRQIGLAVQAYHGVHHQFPPAFTPNWRGPSSRWPSNGLSRHNLFSFLLPFLEEQGRYDRMQWSQAYNAPANQGTAAQPGPTAEMFSVLICPSAPGLGERQSAWGNALGAAATDYAACVDIRFQEYDTLVQSRLIQPRTSRDPRYLLDNPRSEIPDLRSILQDTRTTDRSVDDGLSKSFLLFEDAGRPLHFVRHIRQPKTMGSDAFRWASNKNYFVIGLSTDRACGLSNVMNCENHDEIYSFHTGGANFLYGDGSVQFVAERIAVEPFVAQFTRAQADFVSTEALR